MKKMFLLFSFIVSSFICYSQAFPGLKPVHKKQLLACGIKIPLPTWLPAGFSVETFEIKTGENTSDQEKILSIHYNKKINDSTWQSFMVEANFEKYHPPLGNHPEIVQSSFGEIKFYYQPVETNVVNKKEDLISTDWFNVNNISFYVFSIVSSGKEFQVVGDEDESENKYRYVPVSKEDFKKILQSLQVLK